MLLCAPMTFALADEMKSYGIDSAKDSIKIAEFQRRMAKIHETRPVVALVLSGGGAKGSAHVGTIRRIEELGIPVDMCLGTSMGGLVGGLFSAGYNADQIEEILRSADWGILLSDKVPRDYITYKEQMYKEKYVLSLPFYYPKDEYSQKLEDDSRFIQGKDSQISLGAGEANKNKFLKASFLSSLPSGFVSGQHVTNLLNSLLVGYEDEMDFIDLPVPFVTVGADMVTAKPKIFYSGKLQLAMRSTMSVPGLFAPVRDNGMVLIDGGTRNNYPVDIARMLGADIVIGMELSDRQKDYSEVNNLGDMFGKAISMLGSESFARNENAADVKIKPDLHEFNMLSFDTESVATIIQRGYQAAFDKSVELRDVKLKVGEDTLGLNHHPAEGLMKNKVTLKGISIEGARDGDLPFLLAKLEIKEGDTVSEEDLDHAVATIYGTQAFTYVTYELLGEDDPYELVIHCKPGPVHQFGLGLRFDSQDVVAALVNIGLFTHRLKGNTLDFTSRISNNPYAVLHYSYDAPKSPTLNVSTNIRWTNLDRLTILGKDADMNFLKWKNEAYISNIKWTKWDVRGGIRHELLNVKKFLSESIDSQDYDMKTLFGNYMGLFLDARRYTLDDGYFPTRGYNIGLNYAWEFTSFNGTPRFHILGFDGKFVIPAGKIFTILPSVNIRSLIGDSIPVAFANVVGGSFDGRFTDQQIAFPGINDVAAMDNQLVMARCDLRFHITENQYITGLTAYARDANNFPNLVEDGRNSYAFAIQYGYDSFVGPITADVHWSNLTNKVGVYVNLGYYF